MHHPTNSTQTASDIWLSEKSIVALPAANVPA